MRTPQYSASEPHFLRSEPLWNAAVRVCLETGMPPVFGKEDGEFRVKPRGPSSLPMNGPFYCGKAESR